MALEGGNPIKHLILSKTNKKDHLPVDGSNEFHSANFGDKLGGILGDAFPLALQAKNNPLGGDLGVVFRSQLVQLRQSLQLASQQSLAFSALVQFHEKEFLLTRSECFEFISREGSTENVKEHSQLQDTCGRNRSSPHLLSTF